MYRYEPIPTEHDEYASSALRAAVTLTRWGSVVSYLSERRDGSTRAYVAEAPVAIDRALEMSWTRSGFARVEAPAAAEREAPPCDDVTDAIDVMPETRRSEIENGALVSVAFDYTDTFDELIDILSILAPATLRTLHVGSDSKRGIDLESAAEIGEIGDLTPLFVALPNLEVARFRVPLVKLASIDSPRLRALTLETDPLLPATAHAIGVGSLPRLEALDLCLGWPREGTETLAGVDDFEALFAAKRIPALRSLGLRHTKVSEALCEALARSPLAAQLESLDMSKGNWTTEGARLLAGARHAFPRLRSLDVSGSGLGIEGRTLLEGAYAEVKCARYDYPSWSYKGHPEDPATAGAGTGVDGWETQNVRNAKA